MNESTLNATRTVCAICLEAVSCRSRCFSYSCMHEFCYGCLRKWCEIKSECPMCKTNITSILHNIRPNGRYDEYTPEPVESVEPGYIDIILGENAIFIQNFITHPHSSQDDDDELDIDIMETTDTIGNDDTTELTVIQNFIDITSQTEDDESDEDYIDSSDEVFEHSSSSNESSIDSDEMIDDIESNSSVNYDHSLDSESD